MRYWSILLLFSLRAYTQPLTETQKLASLGKVWGFLKYYHPAVATGKRDWDGQLISLLPQVQRAKNQNELSAIYVQLIDGLGVVKPCRKCSSAEAVPARLRRNFDLSLLNDSTVFSLSLRDRLRYISQNRNQGKNQYVRLTQSIINTNYDNEKPYSDMHYPDEAYRLLALFRYWNVVKYFYPYKYAIDKNWDEVLNELLSVFKQANSEQAYQLALYRMIAQIQDSHGFLSNMEAKACLRCDLGKYWVPFEMKLIDNKAIITRFYNDSLGKLTELKIGTIIKSIDGEPILKRIERERPYTAASNESALLRNVAGLMGVGLTEWAKLVIDADGRDTSLTIRRYTYYRFGKQANESVNSHNPVSRWLTDSIGYINLGQLIPSQADSVIRLLLSAKALIFDVRNYPKETVGQVIAYLNGSPATNFVQFLVPDLTYPGMLKIGPTEQVGYKNQQCFKGKVLVLQNEETQSHAEFTIMALQTIPNITVVGSQTAGADGGYVKIPLPGGYQATMTGQGVYYPDGRETQRIGIVPDIVVRPTIAGIRAGRDEVLERAIDVVRQKK